MFPHSPPMLVCLNAGTGSEFCVVRDHALLSESTVVADVHGLDLSHPLDSEQRLESIAGVVACGIFARRRADMILVGHGDGSATEVRPTLEEGTD